MKQMSGPIESSGMSVRQMRTLWPMSLLLGKFSESRRPPGQLVADVRVADVRDGRPGPA